MLKKYSHEHKKFFPGVSVFLVTRKGEILKGFRIASVLCDLVMLDRPPIENSNKHGFTIKDELLIPNWCEGRKVFRAGCTTLDQALKIVESRKKQGPSSCEL